MDTKSRTRSVYISFLSGERPALGLAIGDTPAIHSQRRRASVRSTREVASLGEPRRLVPAVDLFFMVNACEINVKFYLC
jgi:hypothetical protein